MRKFFKVIIPLAMLSLIVGGYVFYRSLTQPPEKMEFTFSRKEFLTNIDDTPELLTATHDYQAERFLDSISALALEGSRVGSGRRINIAIIGLDSRVGQSSRHADANHVLSFFTDSGFVQITSVPRGTYVNCGYPDTSRENYLANYRPLAGREKYLEKLGQLSKCGSIDYYIEFGFSQAIRLLELMGFKDNAVQMLRVLRSRKSFGASDYQRCYNQGQFIRQMILSQIHKADGVSGDILLRGALMLVETNLPFSEAKAVISALRKTEFPRSTDDVSIMLRPKFSSRINVFDFTSDSVRENLYRYIAATSPLEDSSVTDRQINNAEKISKRIVMNLNNTMARAAEKAKQPPLVIRLLRPILEQRIWNQITDRQKRNDMREKFFALLCEAYLTNGDTLIYHRTRSIEESEIALDDIIQ